MGSKRKRCTTHKTSKKRSSSCNSSSNKTTRPPDLLISNPQLKPTSQDIICGRSCGRHASSEGNMAFRELVQSRLGVYETALKSTKIFIAVALNTCTTSQGSRSSPRLVTPQPAPKLLVPLLSTGSHHEGCSTGSHQRKESQSGNVLPVLLTPSLQNDDSHSRVTPAETVILPRQDATLRGKVFLRGNLQQNHHHPQQVPATPCKPNKNPQDPSHFQGASFSPFPLNEDHPFRIGDLPDLHNVLINQLWEDNNHTDECVHEVLPADPDWSIPVPWDADPMMQALMRGG